MADDRPVSAVDGLASPTTADELANYCRVDWARVGRPVRMLALADRPYGILLHWSGPAGMLCPRSLDEDALCSRCDDPQQKTIWYAMILGHCLRTSDMLLLLIPNISFHRAKARLERQPLSGMTITASRHHAYSTVTIELSRAAQKAPVATFATEKVREIIRRTYARMHKGSDHE